MIKILKIQRLLETDHGMFGALSVGDFKGSALERKWENNKINVSCIPTGEYELKLGMYNKHGYPAYEILDVPDRTHIKIHEGYRMRHVSGCICLGLGVNIVNGVMRLVDHKQAYAQFMSEMAGIKSTVIIITGP